MSPFCGARIFFGMVGFFRGIIMHSDIQKIRRMFRAQLFLFKVADRMALMKCGQGLSELSRVWRVAWAGNFASI